MKETTTLIKIGTRGSELALWQAHFVQQQLKDIGVESELAIIKTKGDKIQDLSFDKIEGKGIFTKEIEDALLRGDIDMAVHSMKDLPTTPPDGLVNTAVSYRADPADWLIIRKEAYSPNFDLNIADDALVGTSSARRKSQMLHFKPNIKLKDIRGNVPTRLRKLQHGDFDAILLAAAGVTRLKIDLSEFEVVKFNPREFVPAPAQGVLAFQTKKEAIATRKILKNLHHSEVSELTNVERKILKLLNGGCHMPLGAYCYKDQMNNFHVYATKAATWDGPIAKVQLSSSTSHNLAERVLEALQKKVNT